MAAAAERRIAPADGEFGTPHAAYIARVPPGDVVATLREQLAATDALVRNVDPARTTVGYAPGKWSIRDVVLHLADAERVMAYRALRIARGDTTPLPGFDENAYVPMAGANSRSMASLLDELAVTRASTVAMFDGFSADAWVRRGTASGIPVTVRALAWIIAGHERHHGAIIRERYLVG